MTRERGSRAESKNCEILLFPTADRRFGTKVKCSTGRASFLVKFPTVRSLTRVKCPGIARGGDGRFWNWLVHQIPFWPLADVVHGSPEFNFSATLLNSQLLCFSPVGILNLVMFFWIFIYHDLFTLAHEKSRWGVARHVYVNNATWWIIVHLLCFLSWFLFRSLF